MKILTMDSEVANMDTSHSSRFAPIPARVPVDLSDWVGRNGLACLALEAATETGDQALAGLFQNDPAALTRAKTLLALLTYCYATGTFASQESERRIATDDAVRYLAANSHPRSDDLRVFRRRWKHLIKQCLVTLLILAWRSRSIGAADSDCEPATPPVPAELLRHFVCDAEQRIHQAVQLDSMDLDF